MLIAVVILVVILLFGFVLAFGPPYVPTLRKQLVTALDMLDLKPGETLLELGSGDGRVVKAAAERGINVIGIEINPVLVVVSRLRTMRYGKQVRIIWGDYFRVRWPEADGIFTFMIQRHMSKLHHKVEKWHTKPVRLASFAFKIPGKEHEAEKQGVFLYEYK